MAWLIAVWMLATAEDFRLCVHYSKPLVIHNESACVGDRVKELVLKFGAVLHVAICSLGIICSNSVLD